MCTQLFRSAGLALLLSIAVHEPARGQACDDVEIIRDEYGVPHVYASTLYGLGYGQGYAQAQDRLWQADLFRRSATGTLASWLGSGSAAGDISARTLFGPAARRTAIYAALSPETREFTNGLVDGMNAWIGHASTAGQIPIEYLANGVALEPWTTSDVIAVAQFLLFNFGSFGNDELTTASAYAALVSQLGQAEADRVFADTHPMDDPSAYTSVPGDCENPGPPPLRVPPPKLPEAIIDAAGQYEERFGAARKSWESLINNGPHSNAVVIGPSLTADGRALLLGGPQTGRSVPQFFHEIGLHGAGVDVTGVGIAGTALVSIGVTPGYAWTFTSGYSDNCDIFSVAVNPANAEQYWYDGAWIDMDCRTEIIAVRGGAPLNVRICETVQGPVVARSGGFAYALAEAYRGYEQNHVEAVFTLNRGSTLAQAEAGIAQFPYNFNVLVADVAGNIAYFHAGRIPVRPTGVNALFPRNGDGSDAWNGIIDWAAMPKVVNPEQGYIVNWNNKPACGWVNTAWTSGWAQFGPVNRASVLANLLADVQPGTATVQTIEEINRSAGWTAPTPVGGSGNVPVAVLLDKLLPLVETSADARLPDLVSRLAAWNWLMLDANGDGRYDDPALMIFDRWMTRLRSAVGGHLGQFNTPSSVDNVIARLADGPDAAVPLQATYLIGQSFETLVTTQLVLAANELTTTYGSNPNNWLRTTLVNVWSSNSAVPTQQTPHMNRGTYNQIVHLVPGGWPIGENVVAPGQSGNPASPHATDQLSLYATWQYKPMRLARADVELHAESTVETSACPPCIGDLTGDGSVDLTDLAHLLANFGTTGGATIEQGDTDRDEDVDLADLSTLLAAFGSHCG